MYLITPREVYYTKQKRLREQVASSYSLLAIYPIGDKCITLVSELVLGCSFCSCTLILAYCISRLNFNKITCNATIEAHISIISKWRPASSSLIFVIVGSSQVVNFAISEDSSPQFIVEFHDKLNRYSEIAQPFDSIAVPTK